jgi:hypothetical protein
MALFDIFRRRSIRELAALATFIDEQATLLAAESVQSYSRLRAGEDAQAVFAQAGFLAALEKARWEAYPIALAMIGEVTEGALRPLAIRNERVLARSVADLVLACFDRKPVPKPIGDAGWEMARRDLSRSLDDAAKRPIKLVSVVADSYAELFLALMPIYDKLGGDDLPALRKSLRAMLSAIRTKLVERADLPALAALLGASAEPPPLP